MLSKRRDIFRVLNSRQYRVYEVWFKGQGLVSCRCTLIDITDQQPLNSVIDSCCEVRAEGGGGGIISQIALRSSASLKPQSHCWWCLIVHAPCAGVLYWLYKLDLWTVLSLCIVSGRVYKVLPISLPTRTPTLIHTVNTTSKGKSQTQILRLIVFLPAPFYDGAQVCRIACCRPCNIQSLGR